MRCAVWSDRLPPACMSDILANTIGSTFGPAWSESCLPGLCTPGTSTRRGALDILYDRRGLTASWQLWVGFVPMSFSLGAVTTLTIVGLVADVGRDHIAVATSCTRRSHLLLLTRELTTSVVRLPDPGSGPGRGPLWRFAASRPSERTLRPHHRRRRQRGTLGV